MWARRVGQDAWQFPQGGIAASEDPMDAMYRELWEETGLTPDKVSLLGSTYPQARGAALYRAEATLVFAQAGV